MAYTVKHLGLPPKSCAATPSWCPASPGFVVDVQDVDLDKQGNWDLSAFPPFGIVDGRSSFRGGLSFIQGKCDEFSIIHASNAVDVNRLLLHGFYTLHEKHHQISNSDRFHSDMQESAVRVQSLE